MNNREMDNEKVNKTSLMEQQPHHEAFELVASQQVISLGLAVTLYQHKATGAMHVHLASDDEENVFIGAYSVMRKSIISGTGSIFHDDPKVT